MGKKGKKREKEGRGTSGLVTALRKVGGENGNKKRERERIFLVGEEDEWWRRDVREEFCLLFSPFVL